MQAVQTPFEQLAHVDAHSKKQEPLLIVYPEAQVKHTVVLEQVLQFEAHFIEQSSPEYPEGH
jgi:hypothetical protein